MITPKKPAYTFYATYPGVDMPLCGEGVDYQVQIQSSLYTDFTLLQKTPNDEPGHDKRLSGLVDKVNALFNDEAKAALEAKRKDMRKGGAMGEPDRLEITVLLTDRGLQLAYVQAGHRKEVAKKPRKPWLRRVLGALLPKSHWEMPTGDAPATGTTTAAPAKPIAKASAKTSKKTAK